MSHLSLSPLDVAALTKELDEFEMRKMEARAVTGVLASTPTALMFTSAVCHSPFMAKSY